MRRAHDDRAVIFALDLIARIILPNSDEIVVAGDRRVNHDGHKFSPFLPVARTAVAVIKPFDPQSWLYHSESE